jgi:hypothetical protein
LSISRLDHLHHAVDMRGGARLVRRLEAAERGGVLVKPVGGLLGDFCDRLVQGQIRIIAQRAGVDLVVHVGDVAHIGDVALAIDMAQQPVEHIKHDQRPGIADMGIVIDRRSADIHADIVLSSIGWNSSLARVSVFQNLSSVMSTPRYQHPGPGRLSCL